MTTATTFPERHRLPDKTVATTSHAESPLLDTSHAESRQLDMSHAENRHPDMFHEENRHPDTSRAESRRPDTLPERSRLVCITVATSMYRAMKVSTPSVLHRIKTCSGTMG